MCPMGSPQQNGQVRSLESAVDQSDVHAQKFQSAFQFPNLKYRQIIKGYQTFKKSSNVKEVRTNT